MLFYRMESQGFRLKVGLDAWSHPGTPQAALANKYCITAPEVAHCKLEAQKWHEYQLALEGSDYWKKLNLERRSPKSITMLAVEPTPAELERRAKDRGADSIAP